MKERYLMELASRAYAHQGDYMKYKAKIWIDEKGEIACCSQKCTEDCPRYDECENVEIKIIK